MPPRWVVVTAVVLLVLAVVLTIALRSQLS
jgi:hypothetical protein